MSEQQTEGDSLSARALAGARSRLRAAWAALRERGESSPEPADWRLASALALLIAAGPLLTLAGAYLLAGQATAETRRIERQEGARIAATKAAAADRASFATLLRRATVGSTLDAFARALPAEAALVRLERNGEGLIEADVTTPDPDRLRAALRREPVLAGLRAVGQRRADLAILVSLREAP